MLQNLNILGDRRAREPLFVRHDRERRCEATERREVERTVAPLQHLHGIEGVALQRLRQIVLERRTAAGGAERAVAHRAACTARDLAEFGGVELAKLIAVELAIRRERYVIDIEIEAHADRVGRDQIVDIAGLIERDLRVARARRERAEHDRSAAALAADQLGDLVNFGGRERDDGGATRQAREFLLAREVQGREPRAREDVRAGKKLLHHVAHGGGAEHQRLVAAAPVEHAVGEDVPALEVGAS